jgi:ATP-binding cassette subfamily B protein IrtB
MIRQLLALATTRGRRILRAVLAMIVVTSILQGAAFVSLVPFLTALLSGDTGAAATWLLTLIALGILYAVSFLIGGRLGQASAAEVLTSLLDRVGDRLVELPLGWFGPDRSGEIANLTTNGIVFAAAAPYAILRPILGAFITPATVLIGAVFIDWRLALTMACTVPLIWIAYRGLSVRLAAADRDHTAAVDDASARVIEFARAQPALRAAGDNSIARGLVDQALRTQYTANRRVHITGGAGIGIFGGVIQFAVIAVLTVGTTLAVGGQLGVATLIAVLVLVVRFTEPIIHSGALGGGISMARNTLDHIQSLLSEPALPEPADPSFSADHSIPADHSIRFDRVTFGYGGTPVLRDISFEARANAMTAIVGPSGSGKTTVTRLIARFYDPEEGTISIGGVPLPQLGSVQVSRAVAPVFQDVYLFDGSILDNIWRGNPDASREQVVLAGQQARVDEIVARLSGGWDASIGEGGSNLSGGERQRVSIARALLKNAPIVLLDEATAALDIGNERAIQDALTAIRPGRTLIVVAHRLQTIAHADHIIMLGVDGSIAEQGHHAELLAAGGGYARYWNERLHVTEWRLTP